EVSMTQSELITAGLAPGGSATDPPGTFDGWNDGSSAPPSPPSFDPIGAPASPVTGPPSGGTVPPESGFGTFGLPPSGPECPPPSCAAGTQLVLLASLLLHEANASSGASDNAGTSFRAVPSTTQLSRRILVIGRASFRTHGPGPRTIHSRRRGETFLEIDSGA